MDTPKRQGGALPKVETIPPQGDGPEYQNSIQRLGLVGLGLSSPPSATSPATLRGSASRSTVAVPVGSEVFQLPERALNAGLSHLRLATGEYAGLLDYASSVGVVLEELEKRGLLIYPQR